MDGACSVNLPSLGFKNNDPEHLLVQIKDNLKAGERPLIITDGMFSVYGYMACLPELLKIAEQYDGIIWIDDAHPSGIIGDNGRGAYEYLGLKSPRLYMGTTLSKAFGGFGGIVPGTKTFIDMVRKGNVLKGASQPPAAAAATSLKGLEILMDNPQMRHQLWHNARRLKAGLNATGIKVDENCFPMAAFTTGDTASMKHIHKKLLDRNIFIQFSTYVGAGSAGVLRMVVFSTHTNEQIDYLVDTLKEFI
jgi:glycine C-acetyltransferase/8-amino-7-oxononanoate synthase